jgi:transcriptional regulator with XRE-family HTH domain
MPEYVELAERIKLALLDNDITGAQLARMVQVSPANVSNWLKGKHGMKEATARKVARVLGKSTFWILHGTDKNGEMTTLSNRDMTLLRMFHALDEDGQVSVMKTMRALIKLT